MSPAEDEPRLARGIRSFSRVTIGAVLSIGDQAAALIGPASPTADDHDAPRALPTGSPDPDPRWRHFVIGTAFAAEDRAVELSRIANRAVGRVAPLTGWVFDAPMVRPARRRIESTIDGLIARGRREEELGRVQAAQLFNNGIEKAVASPKVDDLVGGVVGRVLDPVLDEALPKVLGNLQQNPDLLAPTVNAIVGEVLGPILDSAIPEVFTTLQDRPDEIVGLVNTIVGQALDPIMQQALPKVLGDIEQQPEMMLPLVTALVGKALDPIMAEALPKVLDDIAQQPEMMLPLVQSLVGEVLQPVLADALPQVIDILNEDPEAIRSLVRDQSTGIAADVAHTVRVRAVGADERIDRIVRRMTRRKPAGELAPGSKAALPPGGGGE